MADTKISALNGGVDATAAKGDKVPIARAGANYPVDVNTIRAPNKVDAAADPTVNSDTTAGYFAGATWYNSLTGTMWVCRDATAAAASWVQVGVKDHVGYKSGNWYAPRRGASTTVTVVANSLHMTPLKVHERLTLSALGIRVSAGNAASTALLGIYSNVSGRPGTLLYQVSAAVSTATSSTDASQTFTTPPTLEPGWYWLAALFSGVPGIGSAAATDGTMQDQLGHTGLGNVAANVAQATGLTDTSAFGSGLPASPAGPVVTGSGTALVAYRVA